MTILVQESRAAGFILSSLGNLSMDSVTLVAGPALPAGQVLADVMLSYWPLDVWQKQLPDGWSLNDIGDKRELRDADGKLVTEITYEKQNGNRVPHSIAQHVFKYNITIQYLGG